MNKIKYILIALVALVLAGCVQDKVFDEIKTVPLKRCLEPMNLSARVDANSGVATTFRWDVTNDAEEYLLEVMNASTGAVVLSQTLTGKQVPFETNLEADGNYTFRVTAKSSKLSDSNVAIYDNTIKTYAIKDNLFLTVTGKSAEAISLSWSSELPDYTDVSHIEAKATSGGATIVYDLSEDDAKLAAKTISGLTPSTEYDIVLFFKSASRGAATVYTSPAQGSLTRVSSTEALIAAMTAGDDVYVGTEGSPYAVGSITPAKGFKMLGDYAADGSKPVIIGDIVLNEGFAGDLYFENIHFDGTGRSRIIDHKGGALAIDKISFVNCEISGYACGIYYDNVDGQLDLGEFLIEGCDIYDIAGSGGDGFDVRKNSAISKIIFRNNTVWDSFRSFFRLDDSASGTNVTLGEMVFENNTVKSVATGDKGIFYIRCPWTRLTIRKNLFLHQTGDKAVLATTFSSKPENAPGDINANDNYYFNAGDKFLTGTTNFSAGQISATVLAFDPCFNSKGNFFNLANADLQEKKVGAAKWWNAYVEPVEDLTQGFTEAPHQWDLNDASLFAADLSKSKVRDNLLLVAAEECQMNLDGGINFKAASSVNKKGVPSVGYAAFKVNAPGSVILKVAEDVAGSQVIVAAGDTDGASATVKGSAVAGDALQKIVIADISEESIIYLYATGAVKVTTLAWSPDVAGVNTALAAPKLAIDVDKITADDETPITVSWEAVTNAAGYTVTFNKKKTVTEELSFVIDAATAAALDAGSYTVRVVANPAESDIFNTDSEAAVVAFAVMAPAGGDEPVLVEKTLTWAFSDEAWQTEFKKLGEAGVDIKTNWDITIDGLRFYANDIANRYTASALQIAGGGSKEQRVLTFTAPAAGTLKVASSNTGNKEGEGRNVLVALGDGAPEEKYGGTPSGSDPTVNEYEISGPGTVYIYTNNALRIYTVEFTYMEGGSVTPEPVKVDYVWTFKDEAWQTEFKKLGEAGVDIKTNWDITVDGLRFYANDIANRYTASALQIAGGGSKEQRVLTFTAPVAGTVTVASSNTGNKEGEGRNVLVALGDGTPEEKYGGTPSGSDPTVNEYEISGPGTVYIYTNNALRIYSVEFHSK